MSSFKKLFRKGVLQTCVADGLELLREFQDLAAPVAVSEEPCHALPAFLCILQQHPKTKLLAQAGAVPLDLSEQLDRLPGEFFTAPVLRDDPAAASLVAGGLPSEPRLRKAMAKAFCCLAARLQDQADTERLRHSLGEEALELYREISVLQRGVVHLNSSMKYAEVIASLARECRAAGLPGDYCLVFGKDLRLELVERFETTTSLPLQQLSKLARCPLAEMVLRNNKAELINDLTGDPRWGCEVPGLGKLLLVPLQGANFSMGLLVLAGGADSRPFNSGHLKKAVTLGSVAAISLANAYHFEQVQFILMALIKAMATAIDARDRLTAGHSQRVAQYALGLAQAASRDQEYCPEVRFSDAELQEIFYAGLLHDVGKIGVREEVLTKETRLPRPHLELVGLRLALWGEMQRRPWKELYARLEIINKAYDLTEEDADLVRLLGSETLEVVGTVMPILSADEAQRLLTPRGNLTPQEWEEIKRHPTESHRILQNIPFTTHFPNILTMVLQHHERLDGSGYPHGVMGRELIVQSRIMAIVDVYDALRQDRHYKKALSQEMALTILRQEAKRKKLDSRLVEILCRDVEEIERTMAGGMEFVPGRDFLQ